MMKGDYSMYCRPKKVLPAIVCPTKCFVNHNFENLVQPVVHPSHTTNVNHTNIQQQHFFPHTESVVNEVSQQDLGPAPYPTPYPAPGAVAGAMAGPGPYPGPGMGMGPGGYPGAVAGAMAGPGMGPKGRRFWG
jgi:spore coat protein D